MFKTAFQWLIQFLWPRQPDKSRGDALVVSLPLLLRHWIIVSAWAVIGIIVIPFVVVLETWELNHFMELQRFTPHDRFNSGLVLVSLDDKSIDANVFKKVFGRYPFRRDIYAVLIQAMNRAKAKGLLLDMSFSGGDDEEHPISDRVFVQTLQNSKMPVYSSIMTNYSESTDEMPPAWDSKGLLLLRRAQFRFENLPAEKAELHQSLPVLAFTWFPLPFVSLRDSGLHFVSARSIRGERFTNVYRYAVLWADMVNKASWSKNNQDVLTVIPTMPTTLATLMWSGSADPASGGWRLLSDNKLQWCPAVSTPDRRCHTVRLHHQPALPIIQWHGDQRLAGTPVVDQRSMFDVSLRRLGVLNTLVLQPLAKIMQLDKVLDHSKIERAPYPEYSVVHVLEYELYQQCEIEKRTTRWCQHPYLRQYLQEKKRQIVLQKQRVDFEKQLQQGFSKYPQKIIPKQLSQAVPFVFENQWQYDFIHYQQEKNARIAPQDAAFVFENQANFAQAFANKIILYGITSQNMSQDAHRSIYGSENYPGVYMMTNILDNVLHDDFVERWPWYSTLVVALALGFFAYRCATSFSLVFASLAVVSVGIAYATIVRLLYQWHAIWLDTVVPILVMGFITVLAIGWRYWEAEQRKQKLRFAFAKYVSPGGMLAIEKNPDHITLGGQRKELTFLFSDIRSFTNFCEGNPPEIVQAFLTRYFGVMNNIILNQYQGSINKLIGDAIMAYWGFPFEHENHALQAVKAGLVMRDAVIQWNLDTPDQPLAIGIGINTGEAMIGNVGSEDFMDFTVIGDAVNVAARLESETKVQGVMLIISESTYAQVSHAVEARLLGDVVVKGKTQGIKIYEPIGLRA